MVSLLVKVVTLFSYIYIYPLGFAKCQRVHYISNVQEN